MSYWTEFLWVAMAHLLAVASPGPDFAIVLRQSIVHGRKVAVWTSLGIGTGILVHIGYSLLGIGVLLAQSETWFLILKYVGASYLAWIGLNALRSKPHPEPAPNPGGSPPGGPILPGTRSAFVTGFVVNVFNPKAALFFIALFVTVISPTTPRWIQAGYGIWMALATAAWFTCVSLFFTKERVRRAFLRAGHWFDRIMGGLLLALAARLALASLH